MKFVKTLIWALVFWTVLTVGAVVVYVKSTQSHAHSIPNTHLIELPL